MTGTTFQTPLHPWHVAHGGRMVDFAGWSMPVQYTSIVQEHKATRAGVGLFDISHMGRLRFFGESAPKLLDRLVTRRVRQLKPGLIRYALVTNDQGGILDDVLVYHLGDAGGNSRWSMVVNAGNREKIVRWIRAHTADDGNVTFEDVTLGTAMIAVQGPRATELVSSLVDVDLRGMKYYTGAMTEVNGSETIVSRTGYTGEDGCEIITAGDVATELWQRILDAGAPHGAVPVGLGARDTLRLEAAMPLYGHELNESVHPLQAGLRFAVQMKDHDFIGRDALLAAEAGANWPRRVGLMLEGRRIAREHYPVHSGDQTVGEVTSGTFSPTFERSIAMAYVRPEYSAPATSLTVDIRGRMTSAEVVELPFYSRPS